MSNNITQSDFLEIINKNTPRDKLYSEDEISTAFSRADYNNGTDRTKQIYNIFFNNYTPKDIENFLERWKINKRDIKKIYLTSPFRTIESIAKAWDQKYRITIDNRLYTKVEQIKKEITPRGSDKYKELDKFETYELTPYIAYEMAIRNEEVIKIKKRLEIVIKMKEDDKYLFRRYEPIDKIILKKEYATRKFITNHNFKEYAPIILENERYCKVITECKNNSSLIEEDHNKFVDEHIHKCKELNLFHLNKLEEKLEQELVNEYLIYPYSYYKNIPGGSNLYSYEEVTNTAKETEQIDVEEDNLKLVKTTHQAFQEIQGFDKKKNQFYINSIIPNFKRQVNDEGKITIPINIDLPISEITAYIEAIKENAKIKSPLEILGQKMDRANDLSTIPSKDYKGNDKIIDLTSGNNPQYKLINMLYIYDMSKEGFSYDEISESIEEYFYELGINSLMKDTDTIEKFHKIIIDYIDEKRYKELITGKIESK